ncbi:hypothetical protein D3791_12140 [Glutamicibacter mishrai]|uniref:Uncharacterized protein n=1 Tax=Glutamicibacter mishrai TaxID=1775880 RepID=A0A6H0SKU9_9MICC|nr:hypothetical protein D3791_12140 [Glutamicibacter mishrai]
MGLGRDRILRRRYSWLVLGLRGNLWLGVGCWFCDWGARCLRWFLAGRLGFLGRLGLGLGLGIGLRRRSWRSRRLGSFLGLSLLLGLGLGLGCGFLLSLASFLLLGRVLRIGLGTLLRFFGAHLFELCIDLGFGLGGLLLSPGQGGGYRLRRCRRFLRACHWLWRRNLLGWLVSRIR